MDLLKRFGVIRFQDASSASSPTTHKKPQPAPLKRPKYPINKFSNFRGELWIRLSHQSEPSDSRCELLLGQLRF
jgi:hypothetical protein